MNHPNFKQKIISRVEDFFKHLNKSDGKLDQIFLKTCLKDLELDFEILTNYIQDERLNIHLEGMIITNQTNKRLVYAEKLFKFTQKEFKEIRTLLEENKGSVEEYKKEIIFKFNKYISPKIIWIFEDDKSIEYTALKHLYETGEIK
ncbi:hypothetical protein OAK52_02730 [Chloroflexi bacterium]|jgi:hypothetical protein|nr:hypothetical protein [Chloroflexota bacterium]RZP14139.1 MAG: hypothetical protein EVA32_00800 [Chloroflexota bacterium]|tara:strand:- start:19555 stop:19992 length:438 start_codon:yes stop_codon:yes gene_type:complete